jgi:hypothetical protein
MGAELRSFSRIEIVKFTRFLATIFLAIVLEFTPTSLKLKLKFANKSDENFQRYNFPQLSPINCDPNGPLILLDSFSIPHWAVINSIAAHKLSEFSDGAVATFGFAKRSNFEELLYSRLGVSRHLEIKLMFKNFHNSIKVFLSGCKYIWKQNAIIDFEISGLNIGLDVYESFLRRGHATFGLFSRDIYRELWRGIIQYFFFQPMFESRKVTCVLVSHDNYIGPGLLARIAYKYSVPVFLINPFELNIVERPFQNYERFLHYRKYFASQSISWQVDSLKKSRDELLSRINGAIGIGTMSYQVKSAFTAHRIPRQIRLSPNRKLLILAHDFFDNPHGYSRMLFNDFYQWLEFTVKTCLDENIECYVKLHRDFSEIELTVLLEFKSLHPQITILDTEVSYHQLYDEGIRFVTTCYGSAGHELPLLGFTVINASYNPHIAYSFNYHASSLNEYRKLLSEQVSLVLDSRTESEIYEFYSVHTFLMWPDSFNLNSYLEFEAETNGELSGERAFNYLTSNLKLISAMVSTNLQEALSHRRTFSVERNLQDSFQNRWKPEDNRALLFDKFN